MTYDKVKAISLQ